MHIFLHNVPKPSQGHRECVQSTRHNRGVLTWFELFHTSGKKFWTEISCGWCQSADSVRVCVCAVKWCNSRRPPVIPLPFLIAAVFPAGVQPSGDDCPGITSPPLPLQPISLQRAASHGDRPSKCTKHSKPCFPIALKHTVISMDVCLALQGFRLPLQETAATPLMCDWPCRECNNAV